MVPIVILTIIFSQIDLAEFRKHLARTNIPLFIIGVLGHPAVILVGAIRWKTLIQVYTSRKVPQLYIAKHYWIGFALGIFAPASIGWDIYRIVAAGKEYGDYLINSFIVVIERFLGLITMLCIIIVTYPLVKKYVVKNLEMIIRTANYSYILFILITVLIITSLLLSKNRSFAVMINRLELFFTKKVIRLFAKTGSMNKITTPQIRLNAFFKPLGNWHSIIPILALSFLIHFIAACRNQVFFQSLGYDLPLIVNVFLTPIFFIIYLLPISFGSLGVREGTNIVFYGLFGVPAEIALIVSFYNLSGILLNNLLGGLLIWVNKSKSSTIKTSNP